MEDENVVPSGDIVIQLDSDEESSDWPKYAILYSKGYSRKEAQDIMKRIRKGEISDVKAVPRKQFGGKR